MNTTKWKNCHAPAGEHFEIWSRLTNEVDCPKCRFGSLYPYGSPGSKERRWWCDDCNASFTPEFLIEKKVISKGVEQNSAWQPYDDPPTKRRKKRKEP